MRPPVSIHFPVGRRPGTTHQLGLAIIGLVAALTACSSEPSPQAKNPGTPRPTAASTPSETGTAWTGPTIPNADYQQVLTRTSLKKYGIARSPKQLNWAPDGTFTNLLRIKGSHWAQFENDNGDAPTVGSSGDLSYDEQGRLVENEDCCGESRYTWTLHGDTLTIQPDLAWMRSHRTASERQAYFNRIWMMMCCGTWTKVG